MESKFDVVVGNLKVIAFFIMKKTPRAYIFKNN